MNKDREREREITQTNQIFDKEQDHHKNLKFQ